jgi:uncharacterized protein YjiS (DUF1127 family)
MEGIRTIHGSRPAAHAGYAVIEMLVNLAAAAAQAIWRRISGASRARRMAAVHREMLGMSDHILRDIGLNRSQIDQLFR